MATIPREIEAIATRELAIGLSPFETQRVQRACKRAIDVTVSAAGILVLLVPMALIAIAIRLESRGPSLHPQRRVGRAGAIFPFYKFRTMREDADRLALDGGLANEHAGPIFKMRADPRRTRLGKLLRKTSLDEVPNLFDVLMGHMSLVGPRPPLPHEVAAYNARELRRLTVKPGMTGLWQVSGRSLLSWEDTVRLDLEYIETWSLWHDLVILVRTVPAVILARGAW